MLDMWNAMKWILTIILSFVLGIAVEKVYIVKEYHLINDVQYANYLTIPYKIKCITSGEEMHEWALKNVPAYYDSIKTIIPEEYKRYNYYHIYLEDNADGMSYEDYVEFEFDIL